MSKEVKDYLEYVENVLGGKMYLQKTVEKDAKASLKALVLVPLKLNNREDELLGKILSAISLKQGEFLIQTWDEVPAFEVHSDYLLVFGEGELREHANKFVFPTLSQLMADPDLKKEVWNQIKHLKT